MKYVGKAVKVGIVIKAIKVVANFCAIVCDISAFCVRWYIILILKQFGIIYHITKLKIVNFLS